MNHICYIILHALLAEIGSSRCHIFKEKSTRFLPGSQLLATPTANCTGGVEEQPFPGHPLTHSARSCPLRRLGGVAGSLRTP